MLKLIIIDDEGRKTPVPLVRSEITLGRDEGNTIRLTERNVSRTHARVYRNGEGYRIEDRSRYGIRKNGRKIDADSAFDEGDVLLIGDYRLTIVDESKSVAEPTPDVAETNEMSRDALEAQRRARETAASMASGEADDYADADTEVANHSRLLCLSEPFVGSEFVFRADVLVIGTGSECDLIIDHPSIAAQHARFVREGDTYRVAALAANLVVLQNDSAPGEALRGNDVVRVGDLRFRFLAPGMPVQHVPLEAFDDEGEGAQKLPLVVIVLAAIVVALLVVVIALATGGRDEAPAVAEPEAEAAVAEPSEPEPSPGELRLDEGRAHMDEARWSEAVASFAAIPEEAQERQTADALRERAERELALADVLAEARTALADEQWSTALDRLGEIPANTWHGRQVQEEGLETRALDGYVDAALSASRDAQEAEDLEAALAVVEEAAERAPQDRGLINRIEQLRALQEAREAQAAAAARQAAARRNARPAPRASAPPAEPAAEPAAPSEPEAVINRRERASLLRQQAAREGVQQNFQEAIRLLESARELNPGDPQIDLMLFSNYRQIGNRSRAARAVQRYLQARPNDPRRQEYEEWLELNAP